MQKVQVIGERTGLPGDETAVVPGVVIVAIRDATEVRVGDVAAQDQVVRRFVGISGAGVDAPATASPAATAPAAS
ncbi:hypothetical protein [Catellatospora sp. NPDC049609]|uniref:hypothetical protein n=1 Tax=Catellatospora sp. NPDC049609 TaxID=3155505 RepID=UPI0034186DC8